jgi:hypothetical protein
MIAPLTLFYLLLVISSSSVELIKEPFLTIVVLITRVVLGVVRLAIIVTFATTVGYVVLVELLLLSWVVTFIIGITTSVEELVETLTVEEASELLT